MSIDSETKGLENTALGLGVRGRVKLKVLENGLLGMTVPTVGLPTSEIMEMYDADLEDGLEAMFTKGWSEDT